MCRLIHPLWVARQEAISFPQNYVQATLHRRQQQVEIVWGSNVRGVQLL